MSKRYLDFNTYFKNIFGEKVVKLSLDGGFTCPNRDGLLSTKGCIFCSERGSGDFAGSRLLSMDKQIESQISLLSKKWNSNKYIAYFQNFTNTYDSVENLKKLYFSLLERKNIVGISIATRADCLNREVLDMLEDLNKLTYLWLELGLQSTNENTIKLINRGYSHSSFNDKALELKSRNLKFLVHVIFGLPHETADDMYSTIEYVKALHPFGVKIHSLYIQSDTNLYNYYLKHPFKILTKEEYIELLCNSMEILPKDIVYHRVTGDPNKMKLVAPLWTADKLQVLSSIDRELKIRQLPLINL